VVILARTINVERRAKLAKFIMMKGSLSVKELAHEFNVSTETIRKDLISLEKDNIINKGHGGATISTNYLESHFDTKLFKNMGIKSKIAQKAVELIPKNGVVILDSGTTVFQIAKLLNLRDDLVIITTSLIVAQALENTKNQLLVTGGHLRKKSMSFVGNWAANAISSINADISFMSCDGFHTDGPCIRSYREIDIKQAILKNSKENVLITDSSKFSKQGLYRFTTFDKFNLLITDENINGNERDLIPDNIGLITV